MRTFVMKSKRNQKTVFPQFKTLGRVSSGHNLVGRSNPHSQHKLGKQTVQRLLDSKPTGHKEFSGGTASPKITDDLSHIPLFANAPTPKNLQPKLKIGVPGDIHEQEADRVVNQVLHNEIPEKGQTQTAPLQAKGASGGRDINSGLENQLNSSKGSGSPLSLATRSYFEPRMGYDFSKVKVHTDAEAAQISQKLGAQAFTYRRNIYFGADRYNPQSNAGKRLLAHELAHVVQNNVTAGQHIKCKEDNEKDSRFKRLPPGPGAYTEAEYKVWSRLHPNRTIFKGGASFSPKVIYAQLTPERFWARGYFYTGSFRGGFQGAQEEIWLNNEGRGKEYRVLREPEKKRRRETKKPPEQTKETELSFEVSDIRNSIDLIIKDNKRMDDLLDWLKDHKGHPEYPEREQELIEWLTSWPYNDTNPGPPFIEVLEEEINDYMEGVSDEQLKLLEKEWFRLDDLNKWGEEFFKKAFEILITLDTDN